MTTASICTIGDEILIGQIVDTNSSAISRELGAVGVKVGRMVSIGDERKTIIEQLSKELSLSNIVVCTGGLGPTKDDITKDALRELSGASGYVEHPDQLEEIHRILSSRGLDVLEINRRQAMVPETCEVIVNHKGTAPIMVFPFPESRFGHPAVLYSMPGVPYETLAALPDVIRDIRLRFATDSIAHRNIMTYGLAESALSELISDWEDNLPDNMHLAYLPNPLIGVKLRLSIYGGAEADQQRALDEQIALLRPILGDKIYGEKECSMAEAIAALLKGSGQTLATAESCTGGMIAHLITEVSGSSEYFLGGVVSYAEAIKNQVLNVPHETVEAHGIVSREVAQAMARGVRKLSGATYAVATTGWADVTGDEHEPAGTVWIAVDGPQGTTSARYQYSNARRYNIQRFAASALNLLRLYILDSH